jgi:hypothetical protein
VKVNARRKRLKEKLALTRCTTIEVRFGTQGFGLEDSGEFPRSCSSKKTLSGGFNTQQHAELRG